MVAVGEEELSLGLANTHRIKTTLPNFSSNNSNSCSLLRRLAHLASSLARMRSIHTTTMELVVSVRRGPPVPLNFS